MTYGGFMNLLMLIVYIALVGLFVWAVEYVVGDKMPDIFRRVIYVLCVIFVVVMVLQFFGIMPNLRR